MALTEREISQSHTINDLCVELGKLRRCVGQQLRLLEVVPHAIAAGRLGVAEEYVERVTVSLRNELDT